MPTFKPDYYELLGVLQTASAAEIRRAYRQKIKQAHPDLAEPGDPEDKGRREALSKRLNEAYAVLSDPAQRRSYDLYRNMRTRRQPYPTSTGSSQWQHTTAGTYRANPYWRQPPPRPQPPDTRPTVNLWTRGSLVVLAAVGLLSIAQAFNTGLVGAIGQNNLFPMLELGVLPSFLIGILATLPLLRIGFRHKVRKWILVRCLLLGVVVHLASAAYPLISGDFSYGKPFVQSSTTSQVDMTSVDPHMGAVAITLAPILIMLVIVVGSISPYLRIVFVSRKRQPGGKSRSG